MRHPWIVLCILLLPFAGPAAAHESRPAYLEIVQDTADRYTITWKQPMRGDMALRLTPHLSNGWIDRDADDMFASGSFLIRTWTVTAAADESLEGQTVIIEGLDQTLTDVLLVARDREGREYQAILRPLYAEGRIHFGSGSGAATSSYFRLGVEHILTGIDHLAFVVGLFLLAGTGWGLIKAITAFTVAHSITLAAGILGLVMAPITPIEMLIALSVALVAAESCRTAHHRTLTRQWPWIVAFIFGLLHGFGFAGALSEIGIPTDAIPQALLLFNLGVEAGQLLFIGVLIAFILTVKMLRAAHFPFKVVHARIATAYVIGGLSIYWFLGIAAQAFAQQV